VDWNSDGKKDLLVGDSYGWTYVYINEGTDDNPVLGTETMLTKHWGERSAPYTIDWNRDGKKDLLIGQKDGRILKLININTDEDPQFGGVEFVLAGGEQLSVGQRSNPKMPDWDNDGKRDLISGEYLGFIYFYKNIGEDTAPDFGPREQIKAGGTIIDVGLTARIDIVDWNKDGLLDILSGCDAGTIYYFEQEFIFKIESSLYEEGVGTILKWRSRPSDIYTVYFSDDMQTWTPFPEAIPSQGVETQWIDPTSGSTTIRFYKIGRSE
jgi:hypothetical protein